MHVEVTGSIPVSPTTDTGQSQSPGLFSFAQLLLGKGRSMHTNISLQQLRYIIEVAECGSINAASQQLYVSQPTLSTTIKDTEQELGISIFNRTNRGITLTNEGTEFIGYARQILQQFDLFEARYSNSNSAAKGRLWCFFPALRLLRPCICRFG